MCVVQLAGAPRALRGGMGLLIPLAVEGLAELPLHIVDLGRVCRAGFLAGFLAGLLDGHTDLLRLGQCCQFSVAHAGKPVPSATPRNSGQRQWQPIIAGMTGELVRDRDRSRAWTLVVGGVPHSYVDLDDPRYLAFEYVRRLGHLLDTAAPPGQPLRVLHLGAGALTLARYVAVTRPGSGQLAVDNDPALVAMVRDSLPLPPKARIRVRAGDAREQLETLRAGSFDVVIADVFGAGQTPASLTSAEFAGAARRVLRDRGILAANVADGPPLAHAMGQVATLRAVFPRCCLIADPGVLRGRRFGNLVMAGSDHELPVSALTRLAAADPMPGRVLAGDDLDRFTAGAKPVTDQTARPSPALPATLLTAGR